MFSHIVITSYSIHYTKLYDEQGHVWYEKAVQRGFKESQVDQELKHIFRQLEKSKQVDMRKHLLSLDQERYEWANKWGF